MLFPTVRSWKGAQMMVSPWDGIIYITLQMERITKNKRKKGEKKFGLFLWVFVVTFNERAREN